VSEVGRVLLAAYRNTVDDEGEDESDAIGEVEQTVEGQYGPFLPEASFVAEDGGPIVGGGNALLAAGHTELDLLVTEANEPAVALYRHLGFEQVERLTDPPH